MRHPYVLVTVAAASAVALGLATPAIAAAPPLSHPSITAHFSLPAGQTPENLTRGPGRSTVVTFVGSRQVADVGRDGAVRVLATLPLPADGGVNTPLGGAAAPTGITRAADGTIFFAYAAGDSRLTGLWALRPGQPPRRIAALPAESFPNGIALDEANSAIYLADSVLGTVWKVPRRGGTARVWSADRALTPITFIGANGLKVHRGAVWVSNSDAGTLLRIPITRGGSAGPVQVRATGLTGIDDFAFTGRGDKVLAALFTANRVVLVDGYGPGRTVLDAEDGTQNPTAIAINGSTVVVTNSARGTGVDPNLITARLSTKRR